MINSSLSLSLSLSIPPFRVPHVPWGRHGAFLALSHHRPSQQYAVVAGQRPTKPMHLHCTSGYRFLWQSEGRLLSGSD